MVKYYSLFCFIILACEATLSQPANINVSASNIFGGEPYLAINPSNTQNIVVGWMALDLSTNFKVAIKTKASFDGGNTWGSQFIHPHFSPTWHSADVSLQFRSDGMVYLSYIDYTESDSGGVYVTRSADGGINWSAASKAFDVLFDDPPKIPLDRPFIAVDNSGTVNDGVIYLTTKPAPWIAPPNRAYLKISADNGQTWSAFRYIDTTGYLIGNNIAQPLAFPAVTADGALCIAYPSYLPQQSVYPKFIFAKSYNRGASFQYYDLLVNPSFVTDTLYKLGYMLAANPSNANQLAFTYVGNQNNNSDIFAVTTSNGGLSWIGPVLVNDDNSNKAQDMVWASYDSSGSLVFCWRDRRNGTDTGFYQPSDTYCAVSHDNGATFESNIRLTNVTAPFDSILMQNGNDFLSCQAMNDTIYSAWGDTRTGKLNIFFAKTSISTGTGTRATTIDEARSIVIFPSPAKERFFISAAGMELQQALLKIYDSSGREMLRKKIEKAQAEQGIEVSAFPAGLYYVHIESDGQMIFTQEIIIAE